MACGLGVSGDGRRVILEMQAWRESFLGKLLSRETQGGGRLATAGVAQDLILVLKRATVLGRGATLRLIGAGTRLEDRIGPGLVRETQIGRTQTRGVRRDARGIALVRGTPDRRLDLDRGDGHRVGHEAVRPLLLNSTIQINF